MTEREKLDQDAKDALEKIEAGVKSGTMSAGAALGWAFLAGIEYAARRAKVDANG